jgi:hypothetical protein
MITEETTVNSATGTWTVGPLRRITRHLAYQLAPGLNGRLLQLWTLPTAHSAIPFPEGSTLVTSKCMPDGTWVDTQRAVGGATELLVAHDVTGELWIPGMEKETRIESTYQLFIFETRPGREYPIRRFVGLISEGYGPGNYS